MKELSEIYKKDIEEYLNQSFCGKQVFNFWHYDILQAIKNMLPGDDRSKFSAKLVPGNSLYVTLSYDNIPITTIGITRKRTTSNTLYGERTQFFFKKIELYMSDDTSLEELITKAKLKKAEQEAARFSKLQKAIKAYHAIKKILQEDSDKTINKYDVDSFIGYMSDNVYTLSELAEED